MGWIGLPGFGMARLGWVRFAPIPLLMAWVDVLAGDGVVIFGGMGCGGEEEEEVEGEK